MDPQRFDALTRALATSSRRSVLKALVSLAGSGLLALVGVRPAAARPRPCRPDRLPCPGCCERAICLRGTDDDSCGVDGAPCRRCPRGSTCRNGACVFCNRETCPDGCCVPGIGCFKDGATTDVACGTGGVRCRACPNGTRCVNGTCICDGTSCPNGCCAPDGRCVTPPTDAACGLGGAPCERCGPREECVGGACAPQSECNAENCPGCCDSFGFCRPGTNALSCGKGGEPCRACLSGICQNQACAEPVPCDGTTCPTGCCDSLDTCLPGTSNSACGSGGAACQVCPPDSFCRNQTCVECGPATCPGCCDALLGLGCQPGNLALACGTGGAGCHPCFTGTRCDNGVCICDALSCDGCCDPVLGCLPGNADDACGAEGHGCVECPPGTRCLGGICLESGCTATTCPTGCCDPVFGCLPGRSNASCGTNGVACFECGPGLDCLEGVCRCRPGPTGSCAGGCCDDEAGICRSPAFSDPLKTSPEACGTLGEACFACNPGLDCISGRCQCTQPACSGCCNAARDACLDGSSDDLACGTDGKSCVNCAAQSKSCVNGECACTAASCPTVCCGGVCCGPGQQCSGGSVPFCFG